MVVNARGNVQFDSVFSNQLFLIRNVNSLQCRNANYQVSISQLDHVHLNGISSNGFVETNGKNIHDAMCDVTNLTVPREARSEFSRSGIVRRKSWFLFRNRARNYVVNATRSTVHSHRRKSSITCASVFLVDSLSTSSANDATPTHFNTCETGMTT